MASDCGFFGQSEQDRGYHLGTLQSFVVSQAAVSQSDEYESLDHDQLNQAIKSPKLWGMAKLVQHTGFLAEFVGRWSEGCQCHCHEQMQMPELHTCQWRACRAPQLATGDPLALLDVQLQRSHLEILKHLAEITDVGVRHTLRSEWERARSRLQAELQLKLFYWSRLPRLICGIAHPDPDKSRAAAHAALQQFDEAASRPDATDGAGHQMSRRFLCQRCVQDEQPLRPFVTRQPQATVWKVIKYQHYCLKIEFRFDHVSLSDTDVFLSDRLISPFW